MQVGSTEALPIDAALPEIRRVLDERRAVVVTAAPGAGKTTRVPPALIDAGRVRLLQPRRVAARAIARRIAAERGWTPGREVGWHVRFDRRETGETRLLVATEGILTARLQHDPLLSDFRTVIVDEFHERSIHSDLGLALARQAWIAREDLRIVVMSATIDAAAVAAFLDDCPVIDVPGRLHPIAVTYRPGADPVDVLVDERPRLDGAALVFLPGVREIRAVRERVESRLAGLPVFELHGSLDADLQDAALVPGDGPRVVLATNIAETTLTVPDVRLVIDAGWQKMPRHDAARGVDALVLERVSADAADQRSGRAGRLAPGRAIRLWDSHVRLRPHREPEIARVDLAGPVLEVLAWGGDPRTFEWFEAPRPDRLDAALRLLERLGAVDAAGRLTEPGRAMHRFPLHPRLSRILLEGEGAADVARAAALLSERVDWPAAGAATMCDLLAAVEQLRGGRTRARQGLPVDAIARELQAVYRRVTGRAPRASLNERDFRRAVFTGYADRVARRRAPGSDRFLLATGAGGRLARESGVVDAELIVALDVRATEGADAVIRAATAIEREWLSTTSIDVRHHIDREGVVRAERVERYDAIPLRTVDVPIDPAEAAPLVEAALLECGPRPEDRQLLARARVAGLELTFEELVRAAAAFVTRLDDVDLRSVVPYEQAQQIERNAPTSLDLPSGRRARLDYRDDGRIVASVKLQELFGLAETPRLGRQGTPVLFELLAPNGRPVQVTSDLRSFWTTSYQQVRKELRGRYPRHPWPEDPWTAQPTHRPVKRS